MVIIPFKISVSCTCTRLYKAQSSSFIYIRQLVWSMPYQTVFSVSRFTMHSPLPRMPLKWVQTFPFLRGLCTHPDGRFWRVWSKKLWSVLAWLWASIPKLDKVHPTNSFACKFLDCQWREMERTRLNADDGDDVAPKQAGPRQSCYCLTRRFAVVAILLAFWRLHRFFATWRDCSFHLSCVRSGDSCPALWFIR